MRYYEHELRALKRSGRLRRREISNPALHDFASNDYLGLAHNKELHKRACQRLEEFEIHAPKASLLVGGYHEIHKEFEDALCRVNGFEDAVVVGSGFNANIALIEALVRKGDVLVMDELYHASGMLASNIGTMHKEYFSHNDMNALEDLLKKHSNKKRRIVAVEGIYSMDGDMVPKEIFEVCERYDAILIVDEAHSSGVVGKRLMGVFDHYDITPAPNHIKMGTLGKAYGSFGAYILASEHIVEYLLNRAKPLIYATALGLYDTQLAHEALNHIIENSAILRSEIDKRKAIVEKMTANRPAGLIVPVHIGDNRRVMQLKQSLQNSGYSVGAIREPTVKSAILRVIARLGEETQELKKVLELIYSNHL